jgi:hypothetical protein
MEPRGGGAGSYCHPVTRRPLPLLLLALTAAQAGCSDECLLTVHNDIEETPEATLFSVSVRLEGTSYWTGVDLLDGRIPAGGQRQVRVPPSAPYFLDIQATDGATRSWSRLEALVCDVPDDELSFAFLAADRDRPCTWTVENETGGALSSVTLRRTGTAPWAREVLDAALEPGGAAEFGLDDDRPTWDIRGTSPSGATWTQLALGPCTDGARLSIPLAGPADEDDS